MTCTFASAHPAGADPPAGGRIVVVTDLDAGPAADIAMIQQLDGFGSIAIVDDDRGWTGTSARGADLVVVTASADPALGFTAFVDMPVPVVTWNAGVIRDLAMAATTGWTTATSTEIRMIRADDPLAAATGLRPRVFESPSSLTFGRPATSARIVAHVPGRPRDAVVYSYDPGDSLVDGTTAPACRIALFPTRTSSAVLSSTGAALVRTAFAAALDCASRSRDADGDGYAPPADCDDADPTARPGGHELRGDGVDQDCDTHDAPVTDDVPIDNVVVVLTDDMTYSDYQYMPKTRRLLGADGVTFDDAHQNTPLCCPARATLLTGQRSKHHGVNTNIPEDGEGYVALDHSNTLATWFRAAGYSTTFIGKFLNGYGQDGIDPDVPNDREVPPGWTDFEALVGNLKYYDYVINDNGQHVAYGSAPTDYQTDVLSRRAVASIDRSVRSDVPFYLMVSTQSPHTFNDAPPLAAPRHEGMFAGLAAPRPPSYNELEIGDKPSYVRHTPRLGPVQASMLDQHWRDRLEALQSVDDLVENLVTELRVDGVLDSTLVVFMSDNGYLFGEHRLTGKVRPYEESTHVPLVMRGGPFTGGASVDAVVSSTDVVPTIVALTGIEPGLVMDGLDLGEVLTDPGRYEDRAIIIEMVLGPGYEAVRTEEWLWVDYTASTAAELYDLVGDPYQLENLSRATGTPAAARARLEAALRHLRDCRGADCTVHVTT